MRAGCQACRRPRRHLWLSEAAAAEATLVLSVHIKIDIGHLPCESTAMWITQLCGHVEVRRASSYKTSVTHYQLSVWTSLYQRQSSLLACTAPWSTHTPRRGAAAWSSEGGPGGGRPSAAPAAQRRQMGQLVHACQHVAVQAQVQHCLHSGPRLLLHQLLEASCGVPKQWVCLQATRAEGAVLRRQA